MTLLELVIIAHRCRSTHHFIAMDALSLLKGKDAELWRKLILRHHTSLLKGAKAPDTSFKDFHNHVLHVQEGEWGGARDAAMEWYGKAVEALRNHRWSKAAYALGVMTHYYADPIQPFHTGQTEEESAIHRAVEWSIAKSRETIKAMIDARGYPTVPSSRDTGFVADMVLAGAKYSNPHYQTFIDHYDFDRGVKDPEAGLDQRLLDILADLISYATSGVAILFERAIEEAAVVPPDIDLDLPGYLAALDIPIRKITRRLQDGKDRRQVEAMYAELQATGKVIKTLPADDRKIRKQHAEQVLRTSVAALDAQPLQPIGTRHVALEKPPRPVEYVLKLVPVPVTEDVAPQIDPLTPSMHFAATAPDPEVFDVAGEDVMAAPEPAPVAPPEPEAEPVPEAVNLAPPVLDAEPEPRTEPADTQAETVEAADTAPDDPDAEVVEAEAEAEAEAETEAEPEAHAEGPTPAEQVLAEIEAQESKAAETEPEPAAETEAETPDPVEISEPTAANDDSQAVAVEEAQPEPEPAPEAVADAKPADEPKPDSKTTKAKAKKPKAAKADKVDRLSLESPVVDAPSIGPKTAERLGKVEIETIGDLLEADVEQTAAALNVRYITTKTLTDWQDQTRLMLEAPGLRVLDSQILVGAGIRSADDLANASARSVLEAATSFLETPSGSRVLWGAENPVDEGEVKQWIDLARTAKK